MSNEDILIKKYLDSGYSHECPVCGNEVEFISSGHERDSSGDMYKCIKCDWMVSEIGIWCVRTYYNK